MEDALRETRNANAAAAKAANSAERSLQLSERAELQIAEINLPSTNRFTDKAKLQIIYRNFGRTIATDVIINVRFFEMASATYASTPSILAAGSGGFFAFDLANINGPLSAEKLARFQSGDDLFRVVIEISFTDIFQKRGKIVYDVHWDNHDGIFKFSVTEYSQRPV